jgi:hypothetical protein
MRDKRDRGGLKGIHTIHVLCSMLIDGTGHNPNRSRLDFCSTGCELHAAMRVLAHIREQYSLSLGSYGRPRMTMELKEAGLDVGERRVGRLMKINGIKPVRTRKHKVTTNSNHRLGVAANWLDGDFAADVPNRKWAGDITYIWTAEGWLYLAVRGQNAPVRNTHAKHRIR